MDRTNRESFFFPTFGVFLLLPVVRGSLLFVSVARMSNIPAGGGPSGGAKPIAATRTPSVPVNANTPISPMKPGGGGLTASSSSTNLAGKAAGALGAGATTTTTSASSSSSSSMRIPGRSAEAPISSSSRPISIAPAGKKDVPTPKAPEKTLAQSAPVSNMVPKAPLARPRAPPIEPPIMELPPSLPASPPPFLTGGAAGTAAAAAAGDNDDDEVGGGKPIGGGGAGAAAVDPNKPAATKGMKIQPRGGAAAAAANKAAAEEKHNNSTGLARSLTNNYYISASCPDVNFLAARDLKLMRLAAGSGASSTSADSSDTAATTYVRLGRPGMCGSFDCLFALLCFFAHHSSRICVHESSL